MARLGQAILRELQTCARGHGGALILPPQCYYQWNVASAHTVET